MRPCLDLQVNGYYGIDFSAADCQAEDIARAATALWQDGTAAFLPTMITAPAERYARNLPLLADACEQRQARQARALGIHLEGPFLNPAPGAIGCHLPAYSQRPDGELLRRWQDLARGHIRLLTIAPELPGAMELIPIARALGIVVSLGHHQADYATMCRAATAGASACTHLGNGCPAQLPRHPNVIWDGLAIDDLWMMVIADGVHLAPHVLRSMLRAKGLERSLVVSDCSPVAGLPTGSYRCFDQDVTVAADGSVRTQAGALAGSGVALASADATLADLGYDEHTITTLTCTQPLALLGLDASCLD